jgi:hypothetical protein
VWYHGRSVVFRSIRALHVAEAKWEEGLLSADRNWTRYASRCCSTHAPSARLPVRDCLNQLRNAHIRNNSWGVRAPLIDYLKLSDLRKSYIGYEICIEFFFPTTTFVRNNFLSDEYLTSYAGDWLRLQAGRSWVRFPMRSLHFLIDLILPAALWSSVDSACNRNEYQEFSWG